MSLAPQLQKLVFSWIPQATQAWLRAPGLLLAVSLGLAISPSSALAQSKPTAKTPPDCKDPAVVLTGTVATLFQVYNPHWKPGDAVFLPPKSSQNCLQYAEIEDSAVDKRGHVTLGVGGATVTSKQGEAWPNPHSGIEPLIAGRPPAPGTPSDNPEPWAGGIGPKIKPVKRYVPPVPCPPEAGGGTAKDDCFYTTCPGCGEQICDCSFVTTEPPTMGEPGTKESQWLGTGAGSADGAQHAMITGVAGSGSFFFNYHRSTGSIPHQTSFSELRTVDGRITRYQVFGRISDYDYYFPVEEVDPYDNITRYQYSGGRVVRVLYPSGIDEVWDYNPAWIGDSSQDPTKWDQNTYSGVEVRYEDSTTATVLPGRTHYMVFRRLKQGGVPIQHSRPFAGDQLFRVYQAKGQCLDGSMQNGVFALPANLVGTEQHVVHEMEYESGSSRPTKVSYLLADGIACNATQTAPTCIAVYTYVLAAQVKRVSTEYLPLRGVLHNFIYTPTSDGKGLAFMERHDGAVGQSRKTTYAYDAYNRVASIRVDPPTSGGRPRVGDPDNGGLVEPAYLETHFTYSACSECAKPTAIDYLPSGRREEFEYDNLTGLLVKERTTNPSTGAGLVETSYLWQPCVPSQPLGAYKLVSVTQADGKVWTYSYNSVARATPPDRESWGVKHSLVTVTSPLVTLADATQVTLVSQTIFDTRSPVLVGAMNRQAGIVGQVVKTVDSDGIATDFIYGTYGLLASVVVNGGGAGGNEESVTEIVSDRWGVVTQVTRNSTSAMPSVTNYTADSVGMMLSSSTVVGQQTIETRYLRDALGNLAVVLERNGNSAGGAPDDFKPTNPRTDIARTWLRTEFHYLGDRLVTVLQDRRALDRAASSSDPVSDDPDARFVREDYIWSDDQIVSIVHNNGSVTNHTYDTYGTLYKSEVTYPGQAPVLLGKWYINSALEVVRERRGLSDVPLTTVITRNGAGYVTSVQEPSFVPSGYPWSVDAATHTFSYDIMGRETEVSTSGAAGILRRVASSYDAIGRKWKVEQFAGAGGAALQSLTTLWNGASRVKRQTGPAGRFVEYSFDSMGRVKESVNSDPNHPDKTTFTYVNKTSHLESSQVHNWDGSMYRVFQTKYARDPLGRITRIDLGPDSAPLGQGHRFTYYSTGETETYTDPSGKVEKYLPDALGRLRERFLPGTQPIWNETQHLDWTAAAGQTEMLQVDGRGRMTRTIHDFAGRTRVVMEPGASTVPSVGSEHQEFARFIQYDSASRMVSVATGDEVLVQFDRDGMGRMLMRTRVPTAQPTNLVSWAYGRDELKWDALGQLRETQSRTGFGPGGVGDAYVHEVFDIDTLGRLTTERFAYAGPANLVEIESAYTGDDPFRTGLRYKNNLTLAADDLWLQYTPDAVGRLGGIDWKTTAGAAWTPLATYQHLGAAVMAKQIKLGLGQANPQTAPSFTTSFQYDDYGRMKQIDQSFDPNATVKFGYDVASNLVKEEYAKVAPGRVGDRFAYDEHHRLAKAWLGSDQQHMGASDPAGTVGTFVQKLTYGLDAANNRTSVVSQGTQSGPMVTESYTTQDAGAQAPSNRYDAVAGVQFLYDSRGNTVFDGRFYYIYDALDRLTEVYRLLRTDVDEQMTVLGVQPPIEGSETFTVDDESVLSQARAAILARVTGSPNGIVVRADDPTYVPLLKEAVSSTAVEGSQPQAASVPDGYTVKLLAVYVYDVLNRRVMRIVIDQGVYFYSWDKWQEAQEMTLGSDSQALVARPREQFAWGERFDELLALRVTDIGGIATRYVAEGGGRCPIRLLDASASVLEIQEYNPYGGPSYYPNGAGVAAASSAYGNPFGWRCGRIDIETGLYYARNRYYSSQAGRFMSPDPLGIWGDRYGRGNGYAYGTAAPTVNWDPLGLQVVGEYEDGSQVIRLQFNPGTEQYGTGPVEVPPVVGEFTMFFVEAFNWVADVPVPNPASEMLDAARSYAEARQAGSPAKAAIALGMWLLPVVKSKASARALPGNGAPPGGAAAAGPTTPGGGSSVNGGSGNKGAIPEGSPGAAGKKGGPTTPGGGLPVGPLPCLEGQTRPLHPSDFGVDALETLEGTVAMSNKVATVSVRNIRGNLGNGIKALNTLKEMARASGATSLRIEGTVANERLLPVLERLLGPATRGPGGGLQDAWTVNL